MLNKDVSIGKIIKKYPKVREFLLLNGIDCMNCAVNTCLLKDILIYHNFSQEDQAEMYKHMNKLANGETEEMPLFIAQEHTQDFSNIINTLIMEHKQIKELVYWVKYLIAKPNFLVTYKVDLKKIIGYFQSYADEFHHQKEEDYLFCLFDDKEIVSAMYEEHTMGRDLRKKIAQSGDEVAIKGYLEEFCELLENHIHKEDTVLFPFLDTQLTKEMSLEIDKKVESFDLSLEKEVKEYLENLNETFFYTSV